MMQIKTDSDGLLDLTDGHQLQLIEDSDALMQAVENRLKTFKGEWFLNEELGLPYFQVFFQKNANSMMVYNAISKEILKIPGVYSLTNAVLSLNSDRTLDITFDVENKYGVSTYTGAIQ